MQITGMLHGARLLEFAGFPATEVLGPDASEEKIKALIDKHGLVFIKPVFKGGIGKKGKAGLLGRAKDLKSALAEAVALQGDLDAALHLIDECLEQIERPGWQERVWLAEVLRLKGWMLMRQGRDDGAETQLRASIDCARRQQAKSWELRSSTTLAALLARRGQRDAARELLAPIYGWFTEGFDTKDLIEAKALLKELSP